MRYVRRVRREDAFQKRKYSKPNTITLRWRPSNSPYLLSFRCIFLQGGGFGWRTGFQKIFCYINDSKISSNSKFDGGAPYRDIQRYSSDIVFQKQKGIKHWENSLDLWDVREGQKNPDGEDSIQY